MKRALKLIVICLLISLSVIGIISADNHTRNNNERDIDAVAEIKDYQHWTRVNDTPTRMPEQVSQLCAAPQLPSNNQTLQGPHKDRFITVYVNEIGKQAMMREKSPKFPTGSVIVKAKLAQPNSSAPELLTVMIKREAGYNPKLGDWEFLAMSGDGREVQARGRLENCQACHLKRSDTDFVFRNYLPNTTVSQLR